MHEAVLTAPAANAILPAQRIRDSTTPRAYGNAIFRQHKAGGDFDRRLAAQSIEGPEML